jgi:hypothetical protein
MRGWLLGLFLWPAAAQAEVSPEFCTDRPGLTTGTCIAATGTFQLESSLVAWSHSSDEDDLAIGTSQLRYGLDGRTDIHLAFAPYIRTHEDGAHGSTHHGAGDLSVAVKHVVTPAGTPITIAVMPYIKLPTASRRIGNGKVEAGLFLPVQAPLSGPLSLTLTPEFDWNANGEGDGRHGRYSLAATLGAQLSPRWSASIDGLVGRERDGGSTAREALVSTSLAYLAGPALQLDLQADVGLSRDVPDIGLTSGIAFRF